MLAFAACLQHIFRAVGPQDNLCGLCEQVLLPAFHLITDKYCWISMTQKKYIYICSETPNNCLLVWCPLPLFQHFLSVSWNFTTVSLVSRLSFLVLTLSIQSCLFHHGTPFLSSTDAQGKAENFMSKRVYRLYVETSVTVLMQEEINL